MPRILTVLLPQSSLTGLPCSTAQKWMVMDTLWYKLTCPQGSIYIYNLIPCELFLSIRMVFCAGKKSYFCSQMDSSDKMPACLYAFCPVHCKSGRTASWHCTGSLPWMGCWEVRKHTSGVPLYRYCQTHSWQPVWSWCSKKTYVHIHAYTCIHRILHSLAHRRLQTYGVAFCHYPVLFPVCHFTSLKHWRCTAIQTGLFKYYMCIYERKN